MWWAGLSCLKFGTSSLSRVQIRLHVRLINNKCRCRSHVNVDHLVTNYDIFPSLFERIYINFVAFATSLHGLPCNDKAWTKQVHGGSVFKTKLLTGEQKWIFSHTMFHMRDINGECASTLARPTEWPGWGTKWWNLNSEWNSEIFWVKVTKTNTKFICILVLKLTHTQKSIHHPK